MPPVAVMSCRLAAKSAAIRMSVDKHERVGIARERQDERERDEHSGNDGAARARPFDKCAFGSDGRRRRNNRGRPEQARRPNEQHQRHHDEFDDERELRHCEGDTRERDGAGGDAQRLRDADDDCRDEGAGNRAETAQHRHDECVGDHREVHAEVRGLARQRQRAGKPREE